MHLGVQNSCAGSLESAAKAGKAITVSAFPSVSFVSVPPSLAQISFFFSHLEQCPALYLIFVDKAQGIGLHFELRSQSNSLCVTKRTPGRDFIFF